MADQPIQREFSSQYLLGHGPHLYDDYYYWEPGQVIAIKILNGSVSLKSKIQTAAKRWEPYANIKFHFIESGESHLRILFTNDGFYNAPMGTLANIYAQEEANIRIDTSMLRLNEPLEAIGLHLFGHVLGFTHESLFPMSGRNWNYSQILKDLNRVQWDQSKVINNFLNRYSATVSNTLYDKNSVMNFTFPRRWTKSENGKWNDKLSDNDKMLARYYYPKKMNRTTSDSFDDYFQPDKVRLLKNKEGYSFYPEGNLTIKKLHSEIYFTILFYTVDDELIKSNKWQSVDDQLAIVKKIYLPPGKYSLNSKSLNLGLFVPKIALQLNDKVYARFRIFIPNMNDDKIQWLYTSNKIAIE